MCMYTVDAVYAIIIYLSKILRNNNSRCEKNADCTENKITL